MAPLVLEYAGSFPDPAMPVCDPLAMIVAPGLRCGNVSFTSQKYA
jgi:hypothetical protein